MQRLVQILVVVAWIVGTVVGIPPNQQTGSPPRDESAQILVNTNYVRLVANPSRATLTITTPWQFAWRVTAPTPAVLPANRSAKRSPSEAAAHLSVDSSVIRSLLSLL